MKNIILILLFLSFVSCSEDEVNAPVQPNKVLVKSTFSYSGSSEVEVSTYTYDPLGRPDSVISTDLIIVYDYNESNLITSRNSYWLDENQEVEETATLNYTYENKLVSKEGLTIEYYYENEVCSLRRETRTDLEIDEFFTYEDLNMVELLIKSAYQGTISDEFRLRYTYDENTNPNQYLNSFIPGRNVSVNNLLSIARIEDGILLDPYLTYEYTYDEDGYPLTVSEFNVLQDGTKKENYRREYFYDFLN